MATFLYNKGWLRSEPKACIWNDLAMSPWNMTGEEGRLNTCSAVVDPEKHPGANPLCSAENGWDRIVAFLRRPRTFETECDNNDRIIPVVAQILPMAKRKKKERK